MGKRGKLEVYALFNRKAGADALTDLAISSVIAERIWRSDRM